MLLYDDIGDASSSLRGSTSSYCILIVLYTVIVIVNYDMCILCSNATILVDFGYD